MAHLERLFNVARTTMKPLVREIKHFFIKYPISTVV